MKRPKRIYMDVCCVNRPFDDQAQERIRLETEAIETILLRMEQGECRWVGSDALIYEVTNLSDVERRDRMMELMVDVGEWVRAGYREVQRATQIIALGFKPLDALHIACAETGKADVLLTTDDRFLRVAVRRAAELAIRVANPLRWLEEEIL